MVWIDSQVYVDKRGKNRRRYYLRWNTKEKRPNGRPVVAVEPVGESYRNAVDARERKKEELRNAARGLLKAERITVSELCRRYKEASADLDPDTTSLIHYSLILFEELFGHKDVSQLTSDDLVKVKNELLKKYSPNGVRIKFTQVKACLNHAVMERWLPFSPAKTVPLPPEQLVASYLTKAEVEKLLNVGCAHNSDLHDIAEVALYTGMREGEILRLNSSMISNGTINLGLTKSREERLVPIAPAIRGHFKGKEGLIWEGWKKNRLTRAFRRAKKRAGFEKLRFHDLRHTFAKNYLMSGGTIADLRLIMGHATIRMVQRYAHFQHSHLKKMMRKYRLQ